MGFMDRTVTVRTVVILLLLVLVALPLFGKLVLVAEAERAPGPLAAAAHATAEFPDTARQAFDEVHDRITGRAAIREHIVPPWRQDAPGAAAPANRTAHRLGGLLMRSTGRHAPGWRFLAGVFMIDGAPRNAVLRLDPDLAVDRVWIPDGSLTAADGEPPHRQVLHGFQPLPDGSVALVLSDGLMAQRLGPCGKLLWLGKGAYHHALAGDAENGLWTIFEQQIARLDPETGAQIGRFSALDLLEANPDLPVVAIRRIEPPDGETVFGPADGWPVDPWHWNDANPLPAALAPAFPGFVAGDLLLSAREINSVMIVDPQTLRIKWHMTGETQRQHDPDWHPSGRISIFDNRMGRGQSRILLVDPATGAGESLTAPGFYSKIRGTHDSAAGGHTLVASTQQGHAFDLDPAGEVVLEFINAAPGLPGGPHNLLLTEYRWLPPDAFESGQPPCPAAPG